MHVCTEQVYWQYSIAPAMLWVDDTIVLLEWGEDQLSKGSFDLRTYFQRVLRVAIPDRKIHCMQVVDPSPKECGDLQRALHDR